MEDEFGPECLLLGVFHLLTSLVLIYAKETGIFYVLLGTFGSFYLYVF